MNVTLAVHSKVTLSCLHLYLRNYACEDNEEGTKARLISYFNRHHQKSMENLTKSSATLKKENFKTNGKSPIRKLRKCNTVKGEFQDSYEKNEKSSAPRVLSETNLNSSDKINPEQSKTLENPLKTFENSFETREKTLLQREKALLHREKTISALENSLKKRQEDLAHHANLLNLRSFDLAQKESVLQESAEAFFKYAADRIEKSAKDLQEKEKVLDSSFQLLNHEKNIFFQAKAEITRLECELFLNELISCVVLTDAELKISEKNYYESDSEFSNESEISVEYKKNKEKLLTNMTEATKENRKITDELEEIIAYLACSITT